MKAIIITAVGTIGLVLLADQVQEIGERIPMVTLALWFGSATITTLIFSSAHTGKCPPSTPPPAPRIWANKMRLTARCLLPLTLVPFVEIRHSGYDPALWLIDGVLVVSLCSVPYFWLLSRRVLGAVVLSVCSLSLLWHLAAWALFLVIKRMEAAKAVSTVDTSATFHAFLAPEYRPLFYCLAGTALLIYCPVMMRLGYRRFLTDQTAQTGRSREPAQAPVDPAALIL